MNNTRYHERVFVSNEKLSSKLKGFAKGNSMTVSNYAAMIEDASFHLPCLVPLLRRFFKTVTPDANFSCPRVWRSLLLALSCNTPACGLLHYSEASKTIVVTILSCIKDHCDPVKNPEVCMYILCV